MDKRHLGRATGAIQIGPAVAKVLSPLLAATLMQKISVSAIILIDAISFVLALGALLLIDSEDLSSKSPSKRKGMSLRDTIAGWVYIKERPGLIYLFAFFAVISFAMAMSDVVLLPILLRIGSIKTVGIITTLSGSGMLAGSITMSAWGGPHKRVQGVLGFGGVLGVCLCLMGLHPTPVLIGVAGFGFVFCIPIMNACSQTVLMCTTPAGVHARVTATRMMIMSLMAPVAYAAAGPLCDRIFEPLLSINGRLAGSLGLLIGIGPGRGMGLLLAMLGVLIVGASIVCWANRDLRTIEDESPSA